jgi:nucleoside-diphosphate-sugar epimerase
MAAPFPEVITDESQLDDLLSIPSPGCIEMMKRLEGDILVLGIGGKMGTSLGTVAVNAVKEAGVDKKIIGVDLFPEEGSRERVERIGIEAIACDLLDRDQVATLPKAPHVVFMAGRKFGTGGSEELTWAINALVPSNAASHYAESNIVAFSTGNVYPFVEPASGGCTEDVAPSPLGEYAQSCLGRERVFEYYSKHKGTPVCVFRLNYATDIRYGVIHDIAAEIAADKPVTATVPYFNVIWQGDAVNYALQCLEHCTSPANFMNVTGPEINSTREAAAKLGELMGKKVEFGGDQQERALLSNASKAIGLFGEPTVKFDQLLRWEAHWLKEGGRSLGKPTHFEVKDGKF